MPRKAAIIRTHGRGDCDGRRGYSSRPWACDDFTYRGQEMYQRPGIRARIKHARRRAASVLIVALALLGLPRSAARGADATTFDTKDLAHQTQRLTNDAGQFFMVWWGPQ